MACARIDEVAKGIAAAARILADAVARARIDEIAKGVALAARAVADPSAGVDIDEITKRIAPAARALVWPSFCRTIAVITERRAPATGTLCQPLATVLVDVITQNVAVHPAPLADSTPASAPAGRFVGIVKCKLPRIYPCVGEAVAGPFSVAASGEGGGDGAHDRGSGAVLLTAAPSSPLATKRRNGSRSCVSLSPRAHRQ